MAHSPHSTLNTSRYRPPTASERVPICRADGAICVIGKHPAWHLCSSVLSVGEIMYRMAHSYIPHLTLHVIDHPLPAKECRSAAPMARSVLLASTPLASVFLSAICGRIKLPMAAFNHSSSDGPFHVQRSTFHIPHSTFHIPHYTLFLSARVRAAFTIRHLLRWLLSRQPPPSVVFADPKGAHPRSPKCRRAKVFPLLIPLFCNRNVKL